MKHYFLGSQEISENEADEYNRKFLEILESGDFQRMAEEIQFIFVVEEA